MEPSSLSDYECPICLFILINPLKTPCQHDFCSSCIQEIFDLSISGTIFYILNNFSGNISCPLCRKDIRNISSLKPDETKQKLIETKYKDLYQQRKNELAIHEANIKNLSFIYGNTHRKVHTAEYNTHSWTFFLKLENEEIKKYVEKVVVTLHPTFQDPIITLYEEPFELKRLGWGVFEIPIAVHWKKWTGLQITELKHFLSFANNGSAQKFRIRINLNQEQQALNKS